MYYILHESMDCNLIFYNDLRIVGSGDVINFLCNEKGSLFNCHINLITTRLLHKINILGRDHLESKINDILGKKT